LTGWLTALNQRILNRAPDAQGFAYWQQQLAAGESESNVALGFFDILEAYKNDVTSWFNEYLGRTGRRRTSVTERHGGRSLQMALPRPSVPTPLPKNPGGIRARRNLPFPFQQVRGFEHLLTRPTICHEKVVAGGRASAMPRLDSDRGIA